MSENKGWQGNFFEDFVLDSTYHCPTPRTITSGDISNYIAFTGDRTPRFCQAEGYVHPLIVLHTGLAQTVRYVSLNAVANLGYAGMFWLAPVREGDTLSVSLKIIGLKENSSKKNGIVYVQNSMTNQKGEEVYKFYRWVMVRKNTLEATPYLENPVMPELPKSVAASELKVIEEFTPTTKETGGKWAFEDYVPGERILHYDGMTVNQSDHMSFTRLFQNSAKVHFDAIRTDGKPLIYGGLPISLGYALAYNGLENRLGICGLNGGSHSNPLYTGDTVYAFTEVLEKVDLDHKDLGALRLRMICLKNEDPSKWENLMDFAIKVDDPKKAGRKRYHANVILDFDYWELMPKRHALG